MKAINIGRLASLAFNQFALFAILLLTVGADTILAQDQNVIERAQIAVRDRILRERGGSSVSFPEYPRAQTNYISNAQTGVRGQGLLIRDNYSQPQSFSYEAVVNNRDGRVDQIVYQFNESGGSDHVPSWLVGSFRGRNPLSRRPMTVTINPSGEVSAVYEDGRQDGGRVVGNTIRFGSALIWDIRQVGNGFRARVDQRNERFDRVSEGGGSSSDCLVPRWTVGRFRGTTNSGESELTINADGSATARSLATNRSFSGRYSEGVVTFDFGSFSVAREGDGIRTIEVGNATNQTIYTRARP